MNWYDRTELLLGKENIEKLSHSHVLVAGLGGVGAFAAEMLCRAGVGELTLIDHDSYSISNLNRQIGALHSTIGKSKCEVMETRLKDINPDVRINLLNQYLKDETLVELLQTVKCNYVLDAIDTFSPKTFLIYHTLQNNLRLVSSMGSGGKLNPELIRIADFSKTYECRLAYLLRKRLRKKGVSGGFKTVFSIEKFNKDAIIEVEEENKKSNLGTISYMPSIFGCFCASVVIQDLINN